MTDQAGAEPAADQQQLQQSRFARSVALLRRLFSGWNALGTLTLISAVAIGVGIPIWQNFWVQRPLLSIEMDSITREIAPDTKINIEEYPELALFQPIIVRMAPRNVNDTNKPRFNTSYFVSVSLDDLSDLYELFHRELLDLPSRIDSLNRDLSDIYKMQPVTITADDVIKWQSQLHSLPSLLGDVDEDLSYTSLINVNFPQFNNQHEIVI